MKFLGALILAIVWIGVNFAVYVWGERIKEKIENDDNVRKM